MAHRALDEATPDDETLLPKPLVAHSRAVLGEVVDRVLEHGPPVLVARTGDGGGVECGLECRYDLVTSATSGNVNPPGSPSARAIGMSRRDRDRPTLRPIG